MSGSINEAGSSQKIDAERISPPVEVSSSEGAVGAGFSHSNSLSYASSVDGSLTPGGDWVALDTPSGELMGSMDYLKKVFSVRMESLRSIFTDFNARFASGQFDLSDTQTLLMVFRGMIQDIKILNKAEKVDEVSFNRLKIQEIRLEVAELIVDIVQRQKEIDQKKEALPLKLQEVSKVKQAFIQKAVMLVSSSDPSRLQGKGVEEAVKQLVRMLELEPSDFTREMANSMWKGGALAKELVRIQSSFKDLQAEIHQLREQIPELEIANRVDKIRLIVLLLYLALHVHEEVLVRAYEPTKIESGKPGGADDGEKRLNELKNELKHYESNLARENLRQNFIEWYSQEHRRKKAGNSSSEAAVEHDVDSTSPLNPELVNQAAALHMPAGMQDSAELKGRAELAGQQMEDTLEALSLILTANLPVGEGRVDQPGRENDLFSEVTEAFTWKQVDALLDQLNRDMQQWGHGVSDDTPEESLAIELLESQNYVDAMVAEALQDVEQAGLSIRNRPV